MSQKVSDERGHLCRQICDLQPPVRWLHTTLDLFGFFKKNFITLSTIFSTSFVHVLVSQRLLQSLSPSVMNPYTFR